MTIRLFPANSGKKVFPGFEIIDVWADDKMSIAVITMTREKLPRYPPGDAWACLSTNMTATILAGEATIFEEDGGFIALATGSTVRILAGTRYYWELRSAAVRVLAVNDPPFADEDRKV